MEQTMNNMPKEEQHSLPFFGIPRLFPYLKKYRKTLTWMVICGLLGTGVDILMPVLQRYALNHFIAEKTLDTLPWYILIYVALIVFASCVNFVSCNGAMKTEVSVNCDLRREAFDHLQTLSFSYYNQNSVGWIHSRVMSDTSRIGSLVSWSLMDAVWHTSYLIGALAVMLVINARLALMVMVILPLIVILFSLFQKKLILANRKIRELNSRITGDFNEGTQILTRSRNSEIGGGWGFDHPTQNLYDEFEAGDPRRDVAILIPSTDVNPAYQAQSDETYLGPYR